MNQLDEAVSRYQKLLESEPYKDLAWAESLAERMQAEHLTQGGRLVCPFLRPNFISRRQYDSMVKAAENLFSAINRIKQMALSNAGLLARMQLLPAEKMLASIDPGYAFLAVTSLLDTHVNNGTLRFVEYVADTPVGVAYGEALADLFYDAPPVKEFRKRYALQKLGGKKHLLTALLKAYKQFGGKKQPNIAILEFRQAFQATDEGEYVLLRDFFRAEGYPTEIVSPDQLEYRNGVLRRGDFAIDLIWRRVKVQEFLLRYDLSHPLVRAYRDGAVCVVNSFRSELAHKKAIFDLLTDDTITGSFPAAEKKAIRQYIPWTRVVAAGKTSYQDQTVDLPEFILKNREKLVLKPNDDSGENHSVRGWELDEASWDRALKRALRTPYVVQEKVEAPSSPFPLLRYGEMEIKQMHVDVHPHAYLGKVQGCSSWLTTANGGFSTITGLAPTFILEPKN
ncbi:MAG: circularly permuted type 2 ATP-grasp protein [Acidobacteriota bacterium]